MKTSSLIFTALLCLIAGTTFRTTAATYYVSASGSDAGVGSESEPWLTIQKAANVMVAGDTVVIRPGIYPERVKTMSAGAPGNPITYKASGSVTNGGFYVYHSFITIDGFNIVGNPNVIKFDWEGAIEVFRGLDSISILNNRIHDFDPITSKIYGLHFSYASNATAASANCVVSNNLFKNTSYVMLSLNCSNALVCSNIFDFANSHDAIHCFGANVTIRGNLFTNISANPLVPDHTDIIQTFGEEPVEAYDIVFENNLIVNCVAQLGQLERGTDIASWRKIMNWTFRNNLYVNVSMQMNCDLPGTKIYNNLFYRCTTTTAHVLLMGYNQKGYATNSEIKNNFFIECGADPANRQFGWYEDSGTNGVVADYNFVSGLGGSPKQSAPPDDSFHWGSSGKEAHGKNGGDPGFINAAMNNFHLRAGSIAIDAGSTIGSFATDFEGTKRPLGGAWDIGPFETGTGSSRPLPPSSALAK